jgi:DNA-binding GntR family transcriptional regulator
VASSTEDYVRNLMRPALRRQCQPNALRIIAEGGGSAEVAQIRRAIRARHPGINWDRRYPLKLEDNGIVEVTSTTVTFVERLDRDQIASLLAAYTSELSGHVACASKTCRGVLMQPSGVRYG